MQKLIFLYLTLPLTLAGTISLLLISWAIRRFWRVQNLGFVYGTRRFFEHLYGPKDADYAAHGFLWATIKYHRHATRGGPPQGIIIYLKATMIRELGIKAKGYKGAQPSFPDESTGDQFFNEEQFEAYREVGYRIADTMCQDKQLDLTRILQQIKSSTNRRWQRISSKPVHVEPID